MIKQYLVTLRFLIAGYLIAKLIINHQTNKFFTQKIIDMCENNQKIRPALMGMNVGDSVTFPIARLKSVRTQASELGAIYSRQFTTKTDRIAHTIEVTRVS